MDEIWKDIKGYEGLYQVSNRGNVRSLPHYVNSSVCGSGHRLSGGRVLKQFISTNKYYKGVHLCKNNKVKTILVHRLVAEAYCENNNNHNCVDHIDGNSYNNDSDNLRWCTNKENSNNLVTKSRMSTAKLGVCGKQHNRAKKIAQLDMDGRLIKIWDYVKLASDELNISRANISACAHGRIKSAGGYKWTYDFKVKEE